MTVTGKRAALALKSALEAAGLPRTSGLNGGEVTGWTTMSGSTGFSVAPQEEPRTRKPTGRLVFHVVVSGRPHMRYRSWTQADGRDGTIDLHEPTNPEVVVPRIRAVAKSVGLEVVEVRYSDCSNHWDDDVGFVVVTEAPSWLERFDATNGPPEAETPVLVSLRPAYGTVPASVGALAGYAWEGRTYLTRESVVAVAERVASERAARADKSPGRAATFDLVGEVLTSTDHASATLRTRDVRATTSTNAWGDAVDCWRVGEGAFVRQDEFRPAVPFVVDGRVREALDFAEHDAQFGDDAPWSLPSRAPTVTP